MRWARLDDDMTSLCLFLPPFLKLLVPQKNGKKRCLPLPTLETLNVGFGQYDPDELIMFRQTLDRHRVTAEQERDGLIDRAAPAVHLAGDSGSRSQATQVEVTLTQKGAEGGHWFFREKAKRKD